MEEIDLKSECGNFRKRIDAIGKDVKNLMDHNTFSDEMSYSGQHREMKDNIMIAYRHLEDARMRVGKILQAADGNFNFR